MNVAARAIQFRETLEAEMSAYGVELSAEALDRLERYYQLLTGWNSRLHLVSFHSPQEFATRHVLESLVLLRHFPQDARVADVGSGGGLPIIPCLIARTDLRARLVESSKKKAVFLREAVRETKTNENAEVIAERFENVATPAVDFVTCRALERFEAMVPPLMKWAPPAVTLLLFGGEGLGNVIENLDVANERILLPNSARRFLFVVKKSHEDS
jgi:16S rRNA (guanine527-N7)-methyltransferase